MSEDEGSSIGTSLVVFLLGVAVGAAAAILYAPMAGSETRARLSESAGKLKDRAVELGHEVAVKARDLRERVGGRSGAPSADAETPAIAEG
jgi:gas vesicle protein